MRVAELMHKDVRTTRADSTLAEVVESLADGHVTALPVVDGHGRLLGVVSTADVLEAQAEALTGGPAWETVLVGEVMSRPVLTIPAEADVHEAAQRMLYGEVHRLFVEADGKVIGVISQTDIVQAVARGAVASDRARR